MDEPGAARVGDQPDPDESRDEGRGVGGDPDVARTRKGEPGARDRAVDRGDDRLLERADRTDIRVVGPFERLPDAAGQLGELLQILARAEPATGTGDDDGADFGIGRLLERPPQSVVERAVEGIEDLGPVEGDRKHRAVADGQHLVSHRRPPFCSRNARTASCASSPSIDMREPVARVPDGLVPGEVAPDVQLLLRVAGRLRELGGELLDPLVHGRVELCLGNDLVHEPPLLGLRGGDLVAEEDDLPRPPVAHHELEPLRGASRRHRSVLEADVPDEGGVDHHREIARHLQLVAAADRDAVDARDRRLADLAQPVVRVLEGAEPLPVLAGVSEQILAPGAQVGADAERAAGAGDDDRANVVVPRCVLARACDLAQHAEVEGIQDVRPVEPDRRARRSLVIDDRLEAELLRVARARVRRFGHSRSTRSGR